MATQREACTRSDGVPSCDTGPVGRLRFVLAELRDVGRELRRHMHRRAGVASKPARGASATSKDGA